jgi:hypothetical protein
MKIGTMAALAMGAQVVTLGFCGEAHSDNSQSTGDVIGEVVADSGRDVARGVSVASHAAADSLDGLTYTGCGLAKWAVGERRDRTPTIGNSVVALFFRLPVTVLGAGVCATSAVLSVPAKGIGYGFEKLASDEISGEDKRKMRGVVLSN